MFLYWIMKLFMSDLVQHFCAKVKETKITLISHVLIKPNLTKNLRKILAIISNKVVLRIIHMNPE